MPERSQGWTALTELTGKTPAEQRRLLRLHEETGFESSRDHDDIEFRNRLDQELQLIGLRQLHVQISLSANKDDYSDVPAFAKLIENSPAFVQYLNFYNYFGVRFAAGSISNPCSKPIADTSMCAEKPKDCNEPIVGLPHPPLCPTMTDGPLAFARFVAQTISLDMLDAKVGQALRFLDGFVRYSHQLPRSQNENSSNGGDEGRDFELWMRDLYIGETDRFHKLSAGILKWARNRCVFYVELERTGPQNKSVEKYFRSRWSEGRFQVYNPISSRFALIDFYWLARILRADVSPRGKVSYKGDSWLRLLAMKRRPLAETLAQLDEFLDFATSKPSDEQKKKSRERKNLLVQELQELLAAGGFSDGEIPADLFAALCSDSDQLPRGIEHFGKLLRLLTESAEQNLKLPFTDSLFIDGKVLPAADSVQEEILRMEEILRAVFAYACDLIQNAVEVAENCEEYPQNNSNQANTSPWREVHDHEMRELSDQRREWRSDDSSPVSKPTGSNCGDHVPSGWSRRIFSGEDVHNRVGLAFSGGGIRSATFNLGVLQQLQELDLLRHVDYLSTVSGGGYIGAWLVGNVRRTRYWLSRLTSWDKSIEHLRRYSNYLAPESGLLRADSWSIWGTWIRNAFLIQLTGFTWLSFLLVSILALKSFRLLQWGQL